MPLQGQNPGGFGGGGKTPPTPRPRARGGGTLGGVPVPDLKPSSTRGFGGLMRTMTTVAEGMNTIAQAAQSATTATGDAIADAVENFSLLGRHSETVMDNLGKALFDPMVGAQVQKYIELLAKLKSKKHEGISETDIHLALAKLEYYIDYAGGEAARNFSFSSLGRFTDAQLQALLTKLLGSSKRGGL